MRSNRRHKNALMTRKFTRAYKEEIESFINDLGLQDVDIHIYGSLPDKLIHPYAMGESEQCKDGSYIIRFRWSLIPNPERLPRTDMQFALLLELRHVWQWHTGILKGWIWNDEIDTRTLPYLEKTYEMDADDYALGV